MTASAQPIKELISKQSEVILQCPFFVTRNSLSPRQNLIKATLKIFVLHFEVKLLKSFQWFLRMLYDCVASGHINYISSV